MGLLDWWLRRDPKIEYEGVPQALVVKASEYLVKLVNPQLMFCPRYRERLAPPVASAIAYARACGRQLPAAREAGPDGWAADPGVRVFFGSLDDQLALLNRAEPLQAFFAEQPAAAETYVLLGMACARQTSLGVALRGELVQHDVLQQTVSFSEHRVWLCGTTELTLRRKAAKRLFEQLGIVARDQLAAARAQIAKLAEDRAVLEAQLRHLRRRDEAGERAHVEAQLAEIARALREQGRAGLEQDLDILCTLLANPAQTLTVEAQALALSATNVVLNTGSPEVASTVAFSLAHVPGPTPVERAFTLLRFPRTLLRASGLRFDVAARMLL